MTIITGIEVIRVALPFETGGPRVGMRPTLDPWLKMECVMVRVETADGLQGWGEGFGHVVTPGTEAVLRHVVGPMLIGKDARPIARLMDSLERPLHGLGRSGPVQYALSAVDIASSFSLTRARRRKPAVSTRRSSRPPKVQGTAMASRVMPASGPVSMRSSPSRRLTRVDLPTLGRPMTATTGPSLSVSTPCSAG